MPYLGESTLHSIELTKTPYPYSFTYDHPNHFITPTTVANIEVHENGTTRDCTARMEERLKAGRGIWKSDWTCPLPMNTLVRVL